MSRAAGRGDGPGAAKAVSAAVRFPRRLLRSRLRTRRGNSRATAVPADVADVLARLRALPLSTWSYDFDHTSVKHLGPMAQDFADAFGLGDTRRMIHTVDAAGVSMAAIQALAGRLERLEQQVDALVTITSANAAGRVEERGALDETR